MSNTKAGSHRYADFEVVSPELERIRRAIQASTNRMYWISGVLLGDGIACFFDWHGRILGAFGIVFGVLLYIASGRDGTGKEPK